MTLRNNYHQMVALEVDRQKRLGYTPEHDDQLGLNHLLDMAMEYVANGQTVKSGAMILAAKAYLQRNKKNPMQTAIEEFMRRCDQEVKAYPELPEEKIVTLRIRLMVEELLGKIELPVEHIRAEDDDRYMRLLVQNKSDELIASMIAGDIVGVADGLGDVLYVVIGTAAAYGIDIQEVFDEVHRSNLSKTVWDEETLRWRIEKDEFGKAIKPDTYSPADIGAVIHRQIENGKVWEEFKSDQSDRSEIILGTIET